MGRFLRRLFSLVWRCVSDWFTAKGIALSIFGPTVMTAIGTSIVAWAFTPLGPISVILVAAAAGIAVYFICRHLVKPADTPVSQPVSSAPAAILNEGDMRGTYKINTSGHKQSLHNKGSIDAEMNITATVSEREANKE